MDTHTHTHTHMEKQHQPDDGGSTHDLAPRIILWRRKGATADFRVVVGWTR
jgi:hypothetical protein